MTLGLVPHRSSPGSDRVATIDHSIRRHLIIGAVAGALLFGGIGGWAATTEFAGAVIAPGQLVVDSSVKKVQHPTGGVVGEVNVRDGDRVKTGDVLIRLDETITRANLGIVVKSANELYARLTRLEAERDGAESLSFPAGLTENANDPAVAKLMAGETGLFHLRQVAREGQKSQLAERVAQLEQEIDGVNRQVEAKASEITLIASELKGVKELWAKKLVPMQRVTVLERETARLEGERGQLIASVAQAKGKISETQLQIIEVDQDLRKDVAKEISEIQGKLAELIERRVAAEDQLKRIDLRAPQDGIVHQLSVHTVGGVVTPGEVVMLIVPDGDRLTVEAKIAPQDIDRLRVGQSAMLRLAAFNQRTTPELEGEVLRISPDLSTDQRSGSSYYTMQISIKPDKAGVLDSLRLVAGMPVEAFVQTPARTVLSYLTKPLVDQVRKAFREG
jgi:HlyD family secretion protein